MTSKVQPPSAGGVDAATKEKEEKAYELIAEAVSGKKTWADVLGVNAQQAYNIAQTGYRMLQQGQLEDAEVIFKGLVSLNPKDPYMHLALGSVFHRSGRLDEAIEQYGKAIDLNPKLANAYANRGELYIIKHEQQKALDDLKKAIELDPKGKDPSTLRARAILATAAAKLKEKQGGGAKAPAKKK